VAKGYLRSRIDDLMLLPPDVREWLPAGHVVWFLLDVVREMDTSVLHRRAKLGGAGRCPYDPDMLLALLIYAYAGGLRSSRKIERRCREDVAFMVISGLRYPDHATIARFRADNAAAMEELFAQVLALCGRAGMGSLEHVAIDGTKVVANASRSQSRDTDGLRAVARRLLDEAAAVDEAEDAEHGSARGDELPEVFADPARRREAIQDLVKRAGRDPDRVRGRARAAKATKAGRALALVDELQVAAKDEFQAGLQRPAARLARSEAALARRRAQAQARHDDRAAREAAAAALGRTVPGTRPVPVDDQAHVRAAVAQVDRDRQSLVRRQAGVVAVTGKRNLTDPDARFMPVAGGGFVVGFNCQTAVAADYLVIAVGVTQDPHDSDQLDPMFEQIEQGVAVLRQATGNPTLAVKAALTDAGYASNHNLVTPGPDRLIALGKRNNISGANPPTPPGVDPTPRQRMAQRLSTPEGRKLYKKRGATVEPVNAHLKDQRGLRTASRRGITAMLNELRLAALTTNLLRLHTRPQPPA
jgi:transposase